MTYNMTDILDYLGLSGIIAIVVGVFGHGQLHHRVKVVEEYMAKSADNNVAIARLEEQVTAMRSDLTEVKHAVVNPLLRPQG